MEPVQQRKSPPRTRVSRRNATRRWCIPPAILHEPHEMLEASHLLEEVPGEVGVLLWQSLRDVTLWASVPAARRGGLFAPEAAHQRLTQLLGSGAEPALEVSLTTLAALVGNPASASAEIVSLVCLQVSRWAEGRGAFNTAIGYAQAGALASPHEAEAALSVGCLALRWKRWTRAETWLRRTIGLARRSRDWSAYANAYVELGTLYARRGEAAASQRYYVQAVRAARRHGLIAVRGAALHGLLLLSVEAGELEEAERLARAAMRAYGRGHPRLPELVHDVAYLWVCRDQNARAVAMLQKLLPARVDPEERAFTLSVLARAAAGLGDVELYREAWSDAWSLVNRHPGREDRHARALLELARAATRLRDWPRVEQATRLGLAVAERRGEPRMAAQVEELAAGLRRRPE
jgi:tetratricopeptide (TPR) repeat protein